MAPGGTGWSWGWGEGLACWRGGAAAYSGLNKEAVSGGSVCWRLSGGEEGSRSPSVCEGRSPCGGQGSAGPLLTESLRRRPACAPGGGGVVSRAAGVGACPPWSPSFPRARLAGQGEKGGTWPEVAATRPVEAAGSAQLLRGRVALGGEVGPGPAAAPDPALRVLWVPASGWGSAGRQQEAHAELSPGFLRAAPAVTPAEAVTARAPVPAGWGLRSLPLRPGGRVSFLLLGGLQ